MGEYKCACIGQCGLFAKNMVKLNVTERVLLDPDLMKPKYLGNRWLNCETLLGNYMMR